CERAPERSPVEPAAVACQRPRTPFEPLWVRHRERVLPDPGEVAGKKRAELEAPARVVVTHVVTGAAKQLDGGPNAGLDLAGHGSGLDRLRRDRDAQTLWARAGRLDERAARLRRRMGVARRRSPNRVVEERGVEHGPRETTRNAQSIPVLASGHQRDAAARGRGGRE